MINIVILFASVYYFTKIVRIISFDLTLACDT